MIIFRSAEKDDIDNIVKLVIHIFESEQNIPGDMNYIPLEKEPQWWCVLDNDLIIGAVAIWKENTVYHMGRFVIASEYRGQHLGTELVKYALKDIFHQNVDEIHLEAREATVRIMIKLGGKVIGEAIPFYVGTVTPVLIKRKDFLASLN